MALPTSVARVLATIAGLALLVGAPAVAAPPAGHGPGKPRPAHPKPVEPKPLAPALAAAAEPGLAGAAIVLADGVELAGHDIGITTSGTTYVGWIAATGSGASDRAVHLCVLPLGARACQGGVQSTSARDGGSAHGLKVLVAGTTVRLVWMHDTAASSRTPDGSRVAVATVASGMLGVAYDVPTGVASSGRLLTAAVSAGGRFWAYVAAPTGAAGSDQLLTWTMSEARVGPSTVTATSSPFGGRVGSARFGFHQGLPVLVVSAVDAAATPLKVRFQRKASGGGLVWSGYANVAASWGGGGAFGAITAAGAVRLVSAASGAGHRPTSSSWQGTSFGPRAQTGEKSTCAPGAHDLSTDVSGRIADVYLTCKQVTIANQPTRGAAALARFAVGGTPAGGDPQLVTMPSGLGWVAWSRLAAGSSHRLTVAPIRLPALTRTAAKASAGGSVRVTGPVSCLPSVSVGVGLKGVPRSGWNVASKQLLLDGKVVGARVAGASLRPGSAHTLTGVIAFRKGAAGHTVRASLGFTACPAP